MLVEPAAPARARASPKRQQGLLRRPAPHASARSMGGGYDRLFRFVRRCLVPGQGRSRTTGERGGSLPACQVAGVVGRLPPTTQLLEIQQLAALKLGQPASLPPGLGRSSVGQVCNLPERRGRLATCPTTDCAARTGAQQTERPFPIRFLVPVLAPRKRERDERGDSENAGSACVLLFLQRQENPCVVNSVGHTRRCSVREMFTAARRRIVIRFFSGSDETVLDFALGSARNKFLV